MFAVFVIARSEATKQSIFLPRYGLLRGVYHRARIRATRWLAMTAERRSALGSNPPYELILKNDIVTRANQTRHQHRSVDAGGPVMILGHIA